MLSLLVRQELARVEADVALCRRCYGAEPRLPARLERSAGRGRILVLGERPPRVALEREARIGLSGRDASTAFLRRAVDEAGLPADEILVGAAMLCRPRSATLETAVPRSVCVRECAVLVRGLIRAVQPRLILTLGASALRSLRTAFPERPVLARLRFPESVGRTIVCAGTFVHPLYHVSARARIARPAEAQREDWMRVGRLWAWLESGAAGPPAPAGASPFGVDIAGADVA